MDGFRLFFQVSRSFPKHFDHRRPSKISCLLFIFFVALFPCFHPHLDQLFIQNKGLVILMVKIKLFIGDCPIIAGAVQPLSLQDAAGAAADCRHKPHFSEIFNSQLYHWFKTQLVADIHCFLFGNIFIPHLKANPIAFRIGIRHFLQRFLIQAHKVPPGRNLIFRHIFPVIIQICRIRKISFHDTQGKIGCRIQQIIKLLLKSIPRIVTDIVIKNFLQIICRQQLPVFFQTGTKGNIYLQKKLQTYYQFLKPPFKRKRIHAP